MLFRGPSRSKALVALLLLAVPIQSGAQQQVSGNDPRIFPGDLVRIRVWREPAWDGDYLVDQFGVVTLPLIGDLQVQGETQRSLKARLQEVYGRDIRDLSLTVLVLKRIRVSGEVRSPGIYAMEPTLTVADALLMAAGRASEGRTDEVLLRRGGETRSVNVKLDSSLGELAVETGDELHIRQRSWLDRNAAASLGAAAGFLGLVVALVIR